MTTTRVELRALKYVVFTIKRRDKSKQAKKKEKREIDFLLLNILFYFSFRFVSWF